MSPAFAEFSNGRFDTDRWTDVTVREFEERDTNRCATLIADREGSTTESTKAALASWTAADHKESFVLVAEYLGQVEGYGRAGYFDPSANGREGPAGWYLAVADRPDIQRRYGSSRRWHSYNRVRRK